jgi:hypothetical protein
MLDKALFVSDTIHERTVTLPDGSSHALHFKELPAIAFRKFHDAERSDDEDVRAASMAKLIAASVCEPDGKPALSVEKAKQLTAAAANALIEAVLSVNGFGGKKD